MSKKTIQPVITITGPSGVGKTTLIRALCRSNKSFEEVVSTTTRAPREGEIDGVDYIFISRGQAENHIANDEFLEHVNYHGNIYGFLKSSFADIFSKGRRPVCVVERNGLDEIISHFGRQNVISILVLPSSLADLEKQLRSDNRTEEQIQQRLATVQEETKIDRDFNHVVVNEHKEFAQSWLKLFNVVKYHIRKWRLIDAFQGSYGPPNLLTGDKNE